MGTDILVPRGREAQGTQERQVVESELALSSLIGSLDGPGVMVLNLSHSG